MKAEIYSLMRKPNLYYLALFILIALHFTFLTLYFQPAISGPDSNGYFTQARLIADHGRTWFEKESPLQYTGDHWFRMDDGRFFSRYPPGFPLILAAAFKLGGPKAALLVNPILTSLTLLGVFMVCSLWISKPWALIGTVVMAVNPMVNNCVYSGDSHAATAFFLVWGLYLLTRWARTRHVLLAFSAGLMFGIIPTIRYAETLFCFGMGLFILLHIREERKAWKSLVAASAGALIPIIMLLIRNQMAFGAFWKTAYSFSNEQTAFAWKYFTQNAVSYLQNLQSGGAGLFAGLGLAGIAALCARRDTWRRGVLMLAVALPITILYMSYYFTGPQPMGSMRFLLPTFYVYAIAGVWLLKAISETQPKSAWAATSAVLIFTACWGIPQSFQFITRMEESNEALADITKTVKENVELNSIIIAPAQIQQHLDFIGDWRLVNESVLRSRPRMRMLNRQVNSPDEPMPMSFKIEENIETQERYRNKTTFIRDLDAWSQPERKVYWIGDFDDMDQLVPVSDSLRTITDITSNIGNRRRRAPGVMPGPGGFMGMPGMRQGGMNMPGRGIMQLNPDDTQVVLAEWTLSPGSSDRKENPEITIKLSSDQISLIEQMKERRREELEQE